MIENFLQVVNDKLNLIEAQVRNGYHFEKGLDSTDYFESVGSDVKHC